MRWKPFGPFAPVRKIGDDVHQVTTALEAGDLEALDAGPIDRDSRISQHGRQVLFGERLAIALQRDHDRQQLRIAPQSQVYEFAAMILTTVRHYDLKIGGHAILYQRQQFLIVWA